MLTLFTTCKPFVGPAAVHQRNALRSWTLMDPRPEVIVFGDEEGAKEMATKLDLLHVEYVKRDEYGLPFLDFIFERVQVTASNDLLMWANADVVMVDGVAEAARACDEAFPGGFLGVCRRWDVELDHPLDFEDDWRGELRKAVGDSGELYTPCSSDVFLFKRPLSWAVPPFVAGRPKWDNATLWLAVHHETPVVDVTDRVLLAHPRHGYPDGAGQKAWRGHPSGADNEALAAGREWCFRHVRQAGWLWRLTEDGLEKA
jgi:hypothetical protein